MSFSYQGYTLNTYKDEPWYATEIQLFQDIIAKIGAKGVANVTAHRHSSIAAADGDPSPAFWVENSGDIYIHNGYGAGVLSVNAAGLIESGELTAADVPYTNAGYPAWANVEDALDALAYTSPNIVTLTNNADGSQGTSSILETGSTITAVTIVWSVNKTMTTLELTDAPSGSISPGDTSYSFTGLSITSNKTWTLTVTDSESTTDSQSTTAVFRRKMHWGTDSGASLSSADILALGNSAFATTFDRSFYASPTGEYIYFAYPASFGAVNSVKMDGIVNTFTQSTVSHTNSSGDTVNYYVYRSPNNMTDTNILVEID